MKKTLKPVLLLALLVIAVLSVMAGCDQNGGGGTTQEHNVSEEYVYDDTHHWYACTDDGCDYTEGRAAHVFDQEVVKSDALKTTATCSAKSVYYKSCVCGKVGDTETFESGEILDHAFTNEIVSEETLAKVATCTEKAVYYKSCTMCGEVSTTETFESGEIDPSNHPGPFVYQSNGNLTHDQVCSCCHTVVAAAQPCDGDEDKLCSQCESEDYIKSLFALKTPTVGQYEVGKTIIIPGASFGRMNAKLVKVTGPDQTDAAVTDNKLQFAEEGKYVLVYQVVGYPAITAEVELIATATPAYFNTSDGQGVYEQEATTNYASITNWNRDTVLYVNEVANLAKYSDAIVFMQPRFQNDGESLAFDKLKIKVTDYSDASNFFVFEINADPKYPIYIEARVRYANGQVTERVAYTFCNMYHSDALGSNSVNIWFDYENRKIALGDLANFIKFDTSVWNGFTDGKCIVTLEAEGWNKDSATIKFDYMFNGRAYAYNIDDVCYDENRIVSSFALKAPVAGQYEVGKTIVLPGASFGKLNAEIVKVTGPDSNVIPITDNELTFTQAGKYAVVYRAEGNEGITKEVNLFATETPSYLSTSDGQGVYAREGDNASITTWNRDTILYVNEVVNLAKFSEPIVFTQPRFQNNGTTLAFDKLKIKITDYKDGGNYLIVEIWSNPETPEAVLAKVVYANGKEVNFPTYAICNMFNSEEVGANAVNIWFDYANKKIALSDLATNYIELDTANWSGFTDDKCIVTIEAEGWNEDSASIKFGYMFNERAYAYNVDDICYDEESILSSFALETPVVGQYEVGKTIMLPSANFGELNAEIVEVIGPDSIAVTTADNKLTFTQAGKYTVIYRAEGYERITKEINLFAAETPSYLSTSDGQGVYAKEGSLASITEWNRDTVLYINEVVDLSKMFELTESTAIMQPQFQNDGTTLAFDKLKIKLTDYKNGGNYLTVEIWANPDDPGKVMAKLVYADGKAVNFPNNGVCNMYGMDPINIFFDYAKNQIAVGGPDNFVELDAANWSGFTDGKCVVSLEAEGWNKDSAALKFGFIFGESEYAYNVNDMYVAE